MDGPILGTIPVYGMDLNRRESRSQRWRLDLDNRIRDAVKKGITVVVDVQSFPRGKPEWTFPTQAADRSLALVVFLNADRHAGDRALSPDRLAGEMPTAVPTAASGSYQNDIVMRAWELRAWGLIVGINEEMAKRTPGWLASVADSVADVLARDVQNMKI
ncbi:MAG: hypothetical protein M0R22_13095 [Dehalococcoidia bacterium]|nr:hypothetical protein [Dehalococcoidia bacterium]